jgi:rhodanese-related sulfurtransferase
MNTAIKNIAIGFILGALTVFFTIQATAQHTVTTEQDMIASYYANAVATLVSPHSIREKMSHGTDSGIILVDVRTEEEYLSEHIVTAVNIDTGRDLDIVLSDFQTLIAQNPGKDIIVYCYSAACMNGRKAGNFLADNGVFVKEMTIGWNEWRYDWEMWNYDTEWEYVKVEDFVWSGAEPGEVPMSVKTLEPCGISGELSC